MFPPKGPGGMTGTALAPAGHTPIVPMNGSIGIATLSPSHVTSPPVRSKIFR
jgi:hypothetical protein